jgi:2-succinyl-6-hydroxy-2,4-cyclohexadiene-1-carboxylate synthase
MTQPVFSDYAIATYSYGEGPRLGLLHGFTQTASSWNPIIRELSSAFTCVAADMPGHGNLPDATRALPVCADDIVHSIGPATYVGYSFGARIALHIALQHPQLCERLVLISGTAGIEDDNARAERRQDDELLGEYIQEMGMNRFINEWLSQPLFVGLPPEFAYIEERKQNLPEDMADSLRYAGTGTQEPLWSRLSELTMPVLLVAGRNDTKFSALAQRMHSLIPSSTLEILDNVGHTAHLEDVREFSRRLQHWLENTTQ